MPCLGFRSLLVCILGLAVLPGLVSAESESSKSWGHQAADGWNTSGDETVDAPSVRLGTGTNTRLAVVLEELSYWLTPEQFVIAEEQIIELLNTVGAAVASRVLSQCERVKELEELAADQSELSDVSEVVEVDGDLEEEEGASSPQQPLSSLQAVELLIEHEVQAVISESDEEPFEDVTGDGFEQSSSEESNDSHPAAHDSRMCRVTIEEGRVVHTHPEVPLEDTLSSAAVDDNVVLLGATMGYVDLLTNMICQLKKLHVENFIVAAFDPDIRNWCLQHEIPVFASFLDNPIKGQYDRGHILQTNALPFGEPLKDHKTHAHGRGKRADHWAFATAGFRAVTKLKSLAVNRVLQAGYNVLWLDVDIYLFQNPWPVLLDMANGPVDVIIQSDTQVSDPLEGSLNSGFYYVESNERTISAFNDIIAHTREHPLQSEQPAFHLVLCQQQRCGAIDPITAEVSLPLESNLAMVDGTITGILDRERFPNGAVYWGFEGVDAYSNNVDPWFEDNPPIMVHDNWIKGLAWKIERLRDNRMWLLEGPEGTCPFL